MTDCLLIAFYDFASHVLMSFSVDEILLPMQINLSPSFIDLPFSVEVSPL